MSFDVPPSEWGFVPFSATSEDYPSLPAGEGQPQLATKAGRRAQRTAVKRQQQLQELVEGTIWPLKAAAGEQKTSLADHECITTNFLIPKRFRSPRCSQACIAWFGQCMQWRGCSVAPDLCRTTCVGGGHTIIQPDCWSFGVRIDHVFHIHHQPWPPDSTSVTAATSYVLLHVCLLTFMLRMPESHKRAGAEAEEQSAAAAEEVILEERVVCGAAEPAAFREQTPAAGKRKNRNKFKPDSAADAVIWKSDAAESNSALPCTVVAANSTRGAEQQQPAGSRRKNKNKFKRSDAEATAATPAATTITTPLAPPQTPASVAASQQLPASRSKKRKAQHAGEADAVTDIHKAAGVHPGGAAGSPTTDAPLSRKKQKQLLRQQLYQAQRAAQGGKPVTAVEASTPGGSNPTACHTGPTSVVSAGKISQPQPPAQAPSSAAAASAGAAVLPPAASPRAASPADGPPVSRKQQKRLERARLHKLQRQAGQAASSVAAVQADQPRDSVAMDTDAQQEPAKKQLNGKRAAPKQQQQQQQVLKVSKTDGDDASVRLPPQQRQVVAAATENAGKGSASLLDKMRAKLQGGRFRWLNEQLYSTTGDTAYQLMQVRTITRSSLLKDCIFQYDADKIVPDLRFSERS